MPSPTRPCRLARRSARVVAYGLGVAWLAAGPLASRAGASPLLQPHLGGTVFIGPTSAHPTSIFWNPAAAGLMSGLHVHASGFGHVDLASVDRTPVSTADGEPMPGGGAGTRSYDTASPVTLSPGGFLGLVMAVRDELTFGIGFHTPYAEELPSGEETLRYHTLGGSLSATYGTFSVSLRPDRRIILGAGISAVFTSADLSFGVDDALAACIAPPCDVENPDSTSRYHVASHLFDDLTPAISLNAGVMFRATPRLWLGVSYQSEPSPTVTRSGDVRVVQAPRDGGGTLLGDAELSFRLPQRLHVGARYELAPGSWQLAGELQWIDLSAHGLFDLRLSGPALRAAGINEWMLRYRGFQDVWAAGLMLEQPAGDPLRLGAAVRYRSPTVPADAVSPAQIDGHNLELAGGLEWRPSEGFALTLGAALTFMLPRSVDPSAFSPSAQIDCVASGYDLDRCEAAREGRATPSAAGDYGLWSLGFVVGLSYDRL